MPERKKLTPRGIESFLKKLRPGIQQEIWDSECPGLGLRNRAFVLVACFQRGGHPTRRTLGKVGELTLEQARAKANSWKAEIRAGKDPGIEEEKRRQEEIRKRQTLFGAMAENFIREVLPGERQGPDVARDIRSGLIRFLGDKPVTEITRLDIRQLIKKKKQTAPSQARNLLGYAKRVFQWGVNEDCYGLTASPCAEIKGSEIIGDKTSRDHILSDLELFAFWRATGRERYPFGQVHRLLLLNALRLNECADAANPEFDFETRDWVIPKERMKAKNSKAKLHLVPLTEASLKIIGTMPDMPKGQFIFSCSLGRTPVWMASDVKRSLDARMLQILKAIARKGGDDPSQVVLRPWVNHDLRRTARSKMSGIKNSQGQRIAEEVAEACLAHARPGIVGTYDRHTYSAEKYEALTLWAEHLMGIVEPSMQSRSGNVIPLRRRG